MILAHLATTFAHVPASLAMYFEEAQVSFSVMGLWSNMGWLARCVVILLFIMSIWSLAVIIDRALYFSAARKQSREFAPKVAGALKDGRLDEAIKVADRSKKSQGSWGVFSRRSAAGRRSSAATPSQRPARRPVDLSATPAVALNSNAYSTRMSTSLPLNSRARPNLLLRARILFF